MMLDRAEWRGTGASLAFHAVLLGALSLSIAHVAKVPEPPAMEVELADEVALQSAAPTNVPTPPPAAQAPEVAPPEPVVTPPPAPAPVPAPSLTPKLVQKAQQTPAQPTPTRPTVAKPQPQPRAPRLGNDFLKGVNDDLAPAGRASQASAPKFDSSAKMSVGQSLLRQAQPCADNQIYLGEGANRLRLTINLRFNRNGRLARPPAILAISGDSDLRAKYGELLEDQVGRIFTQCAPFRLPPELYDTPTGGWNDYTFTYRVK